MQVQRALFPACVYVWVLSVTEVYKRLCGLTTIALSVLLLVSAFDIEANDFKSFQSAF